MGDTSKKTEPQRHLKKQLYECKPDYFNLALFKYLRAQNGFISEEKNRMKSLTGDLNYCNILGRLPGAINYYVATGPLLHQLYYLYLGLYSI